MRKLKSKFLIGLYACSGFGINLMNLVMGSYLCSALLIGGFGTENALLNQTYLQKDLVIAALWGAFILVAKILDGIIDIPMAAFTDRLRSRFGRRRPSLVIGLVPLLLSYVLFLAIPDKSGASLLNTVYYGVILCVFYTFYTLTMTTYYATYTEIVETERERRLLSNIKAVCDIFYFVIGYVVIRAMLNGNNIRSVALIVLPIALTMIIPLFLIKEPSNLDSEKVTYKTVGMVKSLKYTFKNKSFVLWMCVHALMQLGVQLFLGGINEYFSSVGMSMMFVMMSTFAPVPFAFILYNRLVRKKGFGFGIRYSFVVFSIGMFSLFGVSFIHNPTIKMVLAIVAGVICSLAVGAIFASSYSVPSQLAAEEESANGVSNSAMYFAIQGLFDGVAAGIATGVILTALKQGSVDVKPGAIIYLTLIAGAATLGAALLSAILPKSVTNMGKEE